MSHQRIVSACCLVLGLLLAGCGGGLQEGSESGAARAGKPQAAAPVLNATALMDWAEGPYAGFFPGHQADQVATLSVPPRLALARPLPVGLVIWIQRSSGFLSQRPDFGPFFEP